jgi:glycosyltransferase involved in cell wall biosynthesis/transposase-like protein
VQKRKEKSSQKEQLLSKRDRLELIGRVVIQGISVDDACRSFGISRPTFYKWKKRYDLAGSSKEEKLEAVADRRPRRKRRSRQRISREIEELIRVVVAEYPEWGKRKIHRSLLERGEKVGIHGVSNALKRLHLNTPKLRERYSRAIRKKIPLGKLLTAEDRKNLVERVVRGGLPVSVVCQDAGVSRNTIYKWLTRYRRAVAAGEDILEALSDRVRVVERWSTQASEDQEKQVLDAVFGNPSWGKYRLSRMVREQYGDAALGIHGVSNVLRRQQLNTAEKRLAWAATQLVTEPTAVSPVTSWLGRLKLAFQQFLPSRAPAPPPFAKAPVGARPPFFKQLQRYSPYFLFSLLLIFSLFQWGRFLGSATSTAQAFGWVFASLALSMGSVFFLYSLKYYFTLAVVLSFSRESDSTSEHSTSEESIRPPSEVTNSTPGVKAIPTPGVKVSGIRGWLARLFGISRVSTSEESIRPPSEVSGAVAGGLEPDLSQVKLERYPFISIHLPMYNEKRVAERILKACSSFDYSNYEIIVADDSTDKTTEIVQSFAEQWNEQHVRLKRSDLNSGMTRSDLSKPLIKVIHRDTRKGFKGGALKEALKHTDPRAEFVVVFDADFVPYPDTLELFLKYFQANAGTLDFRSRNTKNQTPNLKQYLNSNDKNSKKFDGYQWHVLNKSENWITRGVRTEYAGSYVIERSGEELYGGLKQISGSVYMIRRDLLDRFGWGTSITEDFQLTLKLYESGYKVVYTPYIQAPAECAGTLVRLIRQRMRWAEGHSFNIRKMFMRLMLGRWASHSRSGVAPAAHSGSDFTPGESLRRAQGKLATPGVVFRDYI